MYIFLMMLKHASLGFQHNFPFQNWFNFEHVRAFRNLSTFLSICLPTTIRKIIGPDCTSVTMHCYFFVMLFHMLLGKKNILFIGSLDEATRTSNRN